MAGSNPSLIDMARKLIRFIGVIVLSYLTLLCFCARDDRNSNQYLAAQLDKIALLRQTPSPRLVLVGGSNLAFGIDSSRLRQALGVPVVNMGMHAGLGLKYMLDCIRPLLRKDDWVVIVPEYEQFVGNTFEGNFNLVTLCMITHEVADLRYLRPAYLLEDNWAIRDWRPRPQRDPIAPYTRDSFNRDGDVIAHLNMPARPFKVKGWGQLEHQLNYQAVQYLADFVVECERGGIKTLWLFPCRSQSSYQADLATVSQVATALQKRVPHMAPELPGDFVYEDRFFYDTSYHMNAAGRALHTGRMIQALSAWMNARQ